MINILLLLCFVRGVPGTSDFFQPWFSIHLIAVWSNIGKPVGNWWFLQFKCAYGHVVRLGLKQWFSTWGCDPREVMSHFWRGCE